MQFSSQQKPAATSKIPDDDPFAEIMGETDEKKDDVKQQEGAEAAGTEEEGDGFGDFGDFGDFEGEKPPVKPEETKKEGDLNKDV